MSPCSRAGNMAPYVSLISRKIELFGDPRVLSVEYQHFVEKAMIYNNSEYLFNDRERGFENREMTLEINLSGEWRSLLRMASRVYIVW